MAIKSKSGQVFTAFIGTAAVAAAVIIGVNVVDSGDGGGDPVVTSCPLPAYPDETCTGVPTGTTLTAVAPEEGYIEIRDDDTVIDGQDFTGCIVVLADNVTIRNSKVTCEGNNAIYNSDNTGLLVEDVEVSCVSGYGTGIGSVNAVVRRVNIHDCENGLDIGYNFTVEDSYIWDFPPYDPETDQHTDGIQSWDGRDVVIRHNTIKVDQGTSAININNDALYCGKPAAICPIVNTLIEDNLLAGGAYTLYCPKVTTDNFQIINNHFSREYYSTVGAFGPHTDCDNDEIVMGNVYDDTGLPVSF